jgi:pimeloyl-ACP methyl ester carboxylesterase
MPFVKVNDIKIYYEIYGEGFPLVMIMGLGADLNWWTPEIIEPFSQHFKVIIFDNRGAGRTDKPEMSYSIKQFADDTVGLMDALDIKKAHVSGVSMGGMIAQEIALNYPERVEKLILNSTHCGGSKQKLPSDDVLEKMADPPEMTPEEFVNEIIPLIYTEDFIKKNPQFIESYKKRLLNTPIPIDSYRRQIQAIASFNTGMRLKKINTPTLILQGKEDILVPPENANILAKRIANSRAVLFDNAAHALFQPDPERVIKETLNFIKKGK